VTESAPSCHLSRRGVAWEAIAPAPDPGRPGQAGRFGRIESLTVGVTDWPGEFHRFDFGVIDHEAAEFVHVDGSQPFDPRAWTQMPSPGRGRP